MPLSSLVKLSLCKTKAYGRADVYIHVLLTSAPARGEWLATRPGRFTPGEGALSTHWIGGWVGPRTGIDDLKKGKFLTLPGLELRPLGHLVRSQSHYRLCQLCTLASDINGTSLYF
jgi:hypothetical protein